ncbi:helix-turn-helix transcriptional regulator [Achromobacter sp.]|uniref:helix-turn-helix transcriptional regulator n=1 Tax=Achromobacter sp. TaxID=134375 RepID=UPI0028B1EBAC|nr:AlpA family phage regulatory protein [Achromobacter sp.]
MNSLQNNIPAPNAPASPASDRLYRLTDVERVVSLKKSKIYALIKLQQFPRQRKIDGASRWVASEIDQWVSER